MKKRVWKRLTAALMCVLMVVTLLPTLSLPAKAAGTGSVTFEVKFNSGQYTFINVTAETGNYASIRVSWPAELKVNNKDANLLTGWTATNVAGTQSLTAANQSGAKMTAAQVVTYLQGLNFTLAGSQYPDGSVGFRVSASAEKISMFVQDDVEHYYQFFIFDPASKAGTDGGTYDVDPLNTGKTALNWFDCYYLAQQHVFVTDDGEVLRGYLATITSTSEQNTIYDTIAKSCGWLAGTRLLVKQDASGNISSGGSIIKSIQNTTPLSLGKINEPGPYQNYNSTTSSGLRLGFASDTFATNYAKSPTDGFGARKIPTLPTAEANKTSNAVIALGYVAHGGATAANGPQLADITKEDDYYWYWSDGPESGKIFFTAPTRAEKAYTAATDKGSKGGGAVPVGTTVNELTGTNGKYTGVIENYENFASGEPNDSTYEWCAQFAYNNLPTWNDYAQNPGTGATMSKVVYGYFVEYSRPVPTTTPGEEGEDDGLTVPPPVAVTVRYVSRVDENATMNTFQTTMFNGSVGEAFEVFPTAVAPTGYTYVGYDATQSGTGTLADPTSGSNPLDATFVPGATPAQDKVVGHIQSYPQIITFVYQPISVTVTFHPNYNPGDPADWTGLGTVSPTSKTVTYDKAYGALATASRPGYDFAGWYSAAAGGNLISSATIVNVTNHPNAAVNHTLYAHWTPKSPYEVRYDLNGGNIGGNPTHAPISGVNWVQANLLPSGGTPIMDGYTFTGWNVSVNGTGTDVTNGASFGSLAANDGVEFITLQAQWTENGTYAVKYDLNGGAPATADKTGVLWTEDGLTPVTNPTRAGYSFAGWNVTVNGTGTDVQNTDKFEDLAANGSVAYITLQAQWTPKTYTVKYELDGGEISGSGTVADKTPVNWNQSNLLPADPVKDGYRFAGWTLSLVDSAAGDGHSVTVADTYGETSKNENSSSVTLLATWTQAVRYTVIYDVNGGAPTIADKTGVEWTDAGLLPATNPTRAGYTFAGWRQLKNDGTLSGDTVGNTHQYDWLAENTSDRYITLQAQWAANETYTVKYDLNGASAPASIADKLHVRWDATGINGNVTNLDAMLPPTYIQTSLTKTGYTFVGWKLSMRESATVADGPLVNASSAYGALAGADTVMSVTLQAQWVKNDEFVVRFDPNGGTVSPTNIPDNTLSADTSAALRGDMASYTLSKPGYTFGGWTVSVNRNAGVSDAYKVQSGDTFAALAAVGAKTITLKAVWTAAQYTVKYDPNYIGAAAIADKTDAIWDGAGLLPAEPARTHYQFMGWTLLDVDGDDAVTHVAVNNASKFSALAVSDAVGYITLQAQWQEDSKYTVHYKLNGATSPAADPQSKENVYWDDDTLLPGVTPTRTGYTFAGWNVTVGGSGANVQNAAKYSDLAASPGTGSITLTAQWTATNTYKLTYDLNAGTDTTNPASYADKTGLLWGSANLLPGTPTRAGYDFAGWYTLATGGAQAGISTKYSDIAGADDNPANAKTLFAHWTEKDFYRVEYDLNGGLLYLGTLDETDEYGPLTDVNWTQAGLIPTGQDVPTRTGYNFGGWDVIVGGTATDVQSADKYSDLATGDEIYTIKLQAQWTAREYIVEYRMGGVTVGLDTFNGYYYSDATDANPGIATGTKTSAVIERTVAWDEADGVQIPIRWLYIDLAGYHFVGWVLLDDGDGGSNLVDVITGDGDPQYTFSQFAANEDVERIIITGTWDASYALFYNLNGGNYSGVTTPVTDYYVNLTDAVTFRAAPTPPVGYSEFTGWKVVQRDGGNVPNGDVYTVTDNGTLYSVLLDDGVGNVTLEAQYAAKTGYTVNYDVNGATSGAIAPVGGVTWTDDALLPEQPVRTGWTFGGWKLVAADNDNTAATADTALSAVYPAGATILTSSNTYASLATAAKADANFSALSYRADEIMSVTLQAQWTVKSSYSVQYTSGAASAESVANPTTRTSVAWTAAGDALRPATAPVWPGHTLTGWKLVYNGSAVTTTPTIVLADTTTAFGALASGDTVTYITLEAQWTENSSYEVRYDVGTAPNTVATPTTRTSVAWTAAGGNLRPATAPVWPGHTLTGWKLINNGEGTVDGQVMPADNSATKFGDLAARDTVTFITLEAQWTENSAYSVIYDVGTDAAAESVQNPAPRTGNVKWTDAGAALRPATDPVWPGHTLTGWKLVYRDSTAVSGGTTLPASGASSTEYGALAGLDTVMSVTLEAQWTENSSYTVNYERGIDENGTSAPYTITIASRTNVAWTAAGAALRPVSAPVWPGHTLTGWKLVYKESAAVLDGTFVALSDTAIKYGGLAEADTVMSITLQAQWTENSEYSVIYDVGTAAAAESVQNPDTRTLVKWTAAGDDLRPETAPVWPGHRLTGWKLINNGAAATSAPTLTLTDEDTEFGDLAANDTVTSVTLEAQWEEIDGYEVRYDIGAAPNTVATPTTRTDVLWTDKGAALRPATAPAWPGHTLTGWKLIHNGLAAVNGQVVGVTDTTVKFGDLAADDEVEYITLQAQWSTNSSYKVIYDTNGGAPVTLPDRTGLTWDSKNLLTAATVSRPGYELTGWNVSAGGNGEANNTGVANAYSYGELAASDATASITLQAQWTLKTYTVNYDLNGADNAPGDYPPKTVNWTDAGLLPATPPTRSGYIFVGWALSTDADGKALDNTETYGKLAVATDKTSITLRAQWVPVTTGGSGGSDPVYTVIYRGAGAVSDVPPDLTLTAAEASVKPVAVGTPVRPGFTFDGWKLVHNGLSAVDGPVLDTETFDDLANPGAAYIILEAQWTDNSVSRTYTVFYDLGEADGELAAIPELDNVLWTDDGLLPAEPVWAGHTFMGWLLEGSAPEIWVESSVKYGSLAAGEDTMSVTLVAQWKSDAELDGKYLVKYDLNDGTGATLPTRVVEYNENALPYEEQYIPKRKGYNFEGWNVSENGYGEDVDNSEEFSELADSDKVEYIKLQAQWSPKKYIVEYIPHDDDDTNIPDKTLVYWTDAGLLPPASAVAGLTKVGYVFDHWNLKELKEFGALALGDEVTNRDQYSNLADDDDDVSVIVLEAVWRPRSGYTVVYDYNGGTGSPASKTGVRWTDDNLLPAEPTMSAYSFAGWKLIIATDDGNVEITLDEPLAVSALSAYETLALWAKNDDSFAGFTLAADSIMSVTLQAQWTLLPQGGGGGGDDGEEKPPKPPVTIDPPGVGDLDYIELVPGIPAVNSEDHYSYVVGYPDGTVRPENAITRAEVTTIMFRMLTEETREAYWSTTNDFSDVKGSDWFNNAISTMSNLGLVEGYPDGSFKPNQKVTRGEVTALLMRFLNMTAPDNGAAFNDISGHWASASILMAANLGIVNGYPDGAFRPNQSITRAEVTRIINNLLIRHVDRVEDFCAGMRVWPDNPAGKWYYFDIQEATNSHEYIRRQDGLNEIWPALREDYDWTQLEK